MVLVNIIELVGIYIYKLLNDDISNLVNVSLKCSFAFLYFLPPGYNG